VLLLVYYRIASAERTSRSYSPVSFSRRWWWRRRRQTERERENSVLLSILVHTGWRYVTLLLPLLLLLHTAIFLALPYCLFCIQVKSRWRLYLCVVWEVYTCRQQLREYRRWLSLMISLMNDSIDETWKWAELRQGLDLFLFFHYGIHAIILWQSQLNGNRRAKFGY